MKHIISILLLLLVCVTSSAQERTVAQQIQLLQIEHGVHFIYDATLDLNIIYKGENLKGLSLSKALHKLFGKVDIKYDKRGKNIILRKAPHKTEKKAQAEKPKHRTAVSEKVVEKPLQYQLRGKVNDENGELLVNATVYDVTTGKGALTDEKGCYTLFLEAGRHQLRFSYVGYEERVLPVELASNKTMDITLSAVTMIDEVEVTADLNSPVLTTQTGKRTLTANDIHTEFSTLSSPDLVKALQHISGTTTGMELTSDIYVHGGNGDENLYLIDGTPLYHTNHTIGLFSSFNTDIIKTVDFYKSGFPARYSGRVSSIVDVRTNDGNMKEHHGSVSIGQIDGRLHFEGPIVKDKVSYNVGLRRSWFDLISMPIFALTKTHTGEYTDDYKFHYFFYDFNAKVTWRKDNRNTLWASFYRGTDDLKVTSFCGVTDCYDDMSKMQWGKNNATICWDSQLNDQLSLSTAVIGTQSTSLLHFWEDDYQVVDGKKVRNSFNEKRNTTGMYDVGIKADARYVPRMGHQVRFGGAVMHHGFRPQTKHMALYYGDPSEKVDTTLVESRVSTSSNELTLYAEDEMTLTPRFSLNLGSSYTMMMVKGKTYHLLDPRLAMKYQLADWMSAKASVTHMSQSIHRITSSLLSLPTDFWVPTTATFHPTTSWQFAGGLYAQPSSHWLFSVEGFYKHSRHLLQYRNWMGLQPSAADWDKDVIDGDGRSYGLEADVTYSNSRLTLSGGYTLSWSERNFDGFYDGWFKSQFDNRHKVDLGMRLKINKKVSMTAAWNYHSGNRITLPVGYGYMPILPEGNNDVTWDFIYDKPNNYALPAYHRLDLGFDFRHTSKKGREHIWNLSIYNAYCNFNPICVDIDIDWDDTSYGSNNNYVIKTRKMGFIPIIPSFSYTLKF